MGTLKCDKCGIEFEKIFFTQTDKLLCNDCYNSSRGYYFVSGEARETHINLPIYISKIISIKECDIHNIDKIAKLVTDRENFFIKTINKL